MKKIVSLVLAILMACIGTASVYAQATPDGVVPVETESTATATQVSGSNTASDEMAVDGTSSSDGEEIGAVAELPELRTADTKHFRLDNGMYTAVRYPQAVHRLDTTGNWVDIDNRLTLRSVSGENMYSTSDARVSFAASYVPGEQLVTLSENGYTVSMGLMADILSPGNGNISTEEQPLDRWASPTVVNGEARPASMKYDTIEEAMEQNDSSSVTYNDVRPNTALSYELQGNTIKENIIVSAANDAYEYTFLLNLTGLTATLEETGEILLKDTTTGAAMYTIPAPYMYDAAGQRSYDVSYELVQVKSGLYLLNVSADAAWINAAERTFPVTIDPTILVSEDLVIVDAYTSSSNPTTNYGSETAMYVDATRTSYVRFNLPELPAGSEVNKTYLYLPYYYTATAGSMEIGVYTVTSSWNESTITHASAPTVDTTCLYTKTFTVSEDITESEPGLVRLSIHEAGQDWYAGNPNYGVALKWHTGTTSPMVFQTHEADNGDSPIVGINYTRYVPDGVYCLSVKSDSTRWMTVENDSTVAGSHVQQVAYTRAPSIFFIRASLFKISRVGDTNRYIIRSMLNNNLSFGVSGTEIVTKTIPSNDADVTDADTFYIEWDEDAFVIRPYGSTNVLHMSNTSTPNLTTIAQESATANSRWEFVMYVGSHACGVVDCSGTWSNLGVVQGVESQADFISWSTYINANTLHMDLASEYEDMASAAWNSETGTLTLTAYCLGDMQIDFNIQNSGTMTSVQQGVFEAFVIPREGGYYIQNAATEKYVYMPGPGTNNVQQWSFLLHAISEKWIVEHVYGSNGYVRLKSAYSNRYLGVSSTDSTVIRHNAAQNDYTLWRIEPTSSGNLKLTCKATRSTGTVLSVPSSSSGDGVNLTQLAYTDDANYRDEWRFEPCSAVFYGVYDVNHDHISCLNTIATDTTDVLWSDITVREGEIPASTCQSDLLSTNIFISRSHAGPVTDKETGEVVATGLLLNRKDADRAAGFFSHQWSPMNTISDYLRSTEDYSNVYLAVFIGCDTGHGGEGAKNLPTAIVEYGAVAAIGFEGRINCAEANEWTLNLYSRMKEGATLRQAVQFACDTADEQSELKSIDNVVICGDDTITFP